jgi:pimeloyl-ACP methyl ester carboxylesterase
VTIAETGTLLGRIPFARVGAAADPVVVVSGGQAFVQRPTPERVARDARRIARIMPRGRSFVLVGYDFVLVGYDPTPADYQLTTIARDVCAILEQLGACNAIGISYGGLVALRAAAERPDLVTRLVLLASAHDFSAEGKRRVAQQIEHAGQGDLVALATQFAGLCRRPWLNWLVRARLRTMRTRLPQAFNEPALIVRGLRAVQDDSIEPTVLARVTAACLLVGGTRDQFFGDGMQEHTAALVPRAQLALADGETHMLPIERPRFVARALRAFLT